MSWTIGGVALDVDEEPDDGELHVVGEGVWSLAIPLGATGRRLKQRPAVGPPPPSRLHAFWSEATKNAIKALHDAGDPVTVTITEVPYYATGVEMTILEMTAALTSQVRGLPWYDCTFTLAE